MILKIINAYDGFWDAYVDIGGIKLLLRDRLSTPVVEEVLIKYDYMLQTVDSTKEITIEHRALRVIQGLTIVRETEL